MLTVVGNICEKDFHGDEMSADKIDKRSTTIQRS